MRGFKQLICMGVLFIFIISSYIGYADDSIESFVFDCNPNEKYNIELIFSPVEKLDKTEVIEGKWTYKYKNKKGRLYTEGREKLPNNGSVRIDLVSILRKSNSKQEESYLWHVIAHPRVSGWKFGGHWATNKLLTDYTKINKSHRKTMKKLSVYKKEEPVYSMVAIRNIGDSELLNTAWQEVFGTAIVDDLVIPNNMLALGSKKGYSFTFYYVPTPDPIGINEDGHRWVSSKHIDKPGKVFGFVLTPKGKCLKWTSLDIVK